MYVPVDAIELSNEVLEIARKNNHKLAAAESCTAGLISATLTEIPGASKAFDRGFVTYSNEAKSEMLDVPPEMIKQCGAVSEEVVRAMAEGAIYYSNADFAVAVTGIAGPAGGSADKPVGLVHFAVSSKHYPQIHRKKIFAAMDRENVRAATVEYAMIMLIESMTQKPRMSPD
ncbi:CinA family protein [Cohaesibacter celericrescens]|uniref:Damage-inducible protein CinA n=1 Tax=Cohaesibacter celericrescens TaxID=2067669 RepID=A0A2N5XSW3_9HYPH|nr:CinA family protein [Cohaesibacter celericrescens]PLW77594.1 damage-inducible protein CinA [Cohaesibacter celericrescens]